SGGVLRDVLAVGAALAGAELVGQLAVGADGALEVVERAVADLALGRLVGALGGSSDLVVAVAGRDRGRSGRRRAVLAEDHVQGRVAELGDQRDDEDRRDGEGDDQGVARDGALLRCAHALTSGRSALGAVHPAVLPLLTDRRSVEGEGGGEPEEDDRDDAEADGVPTVAHPSGDGLEHARDGSSVPGRVLVWHSGSAELAGVLGVGGRRRDGRGAGRTGTRLA